MIIPICLRLFYVVDRIDLDFNGLASGAATIKSVVFVIFGSEISREKRIWCRVYTIPLFYLVDHTYILVLTS